MSHNRKIYLLDPQQLPPETIAVTFAKTSRSPESFAQIASELSETKSAEFNEKWVVGYGHSSVAEHAVLHIAVENISRLAVENLESNRLASYTEKSTRYQTWDADAFHIPEELADSPLRAVFVDTCNKLLSTYRELLPIIQDFLQSTNPPVQGESATARERRLRTHAIDHCRFLLPAAVLANVGVTINARALEHAVGKLLTSPLLEVRTVGEEIKEAAVGSVPTLLKYANEIPYLREVEERFGEIPVSGLVDTQSWCNLVDYSSNGLDRVLTATLYRQHQVDYPSARLTIEMMSDEQRSALTRVLFGSIGKHTIPARELENAAFTFDLLLDQGAYYEVKRHRMMTQVPQPLSVEQGYAVPRLFDSAGVLAQYQNAMDEVLAVYHKIARFNPQIAAYLVPNGFNRRVILTLNLRSAIHFIKLRSACNAHFSVRRAAQRMAEEITRVLPELEGLLGRNPEETSASVEAEYFLATS